MNQLPKDCNVLQDKKTFSHDISALDKALSEGDTKNVGEKSQCGDVIHAEGFSRGLRIWLHTLNSVVRLNREGRHVMMSQFSWNLRTLRN